MPIDVIKLENRVEALQKLQNQRLDGRKLSKLPPELQIDYCRTHKELGELTYECYEALRDAPGSFLLAAEYFILADLEFSSLKAVADINAAAEQDAIQTIENIIPSSDPEVDLKLAICHLLGIGIAKNRANAIALLQMAAANHDTRALALLGGFYFSGKGSPTNHQEGIRFIRNAAEQGNVYAQGVLGNLYRNGQTVTIDYVEAAKWLRCAAEQGDALAQGNLAMLYDKGEEGVPQDKHEAFKWFRCCAEQGILRAKYDIAQKYDEGGGVPQDKRQAARWFRQAAEQGSKSSIKKLTQSDDLFLKYHEAMMRGDKEGVIQLVKDNPDLSKELVFDMERATRESPWLDTALKIISQLISLGVHPKKLSSELHEYHVKKIVQIHQQLHLYEEGYNEESLEETLGHLSKINAVDIPVDDLNLFINLIIDLWYQSKALNREAIVTPVAGAILTSLVFKSISAGSLKKIDELRNCMLICVKQRFGLQFEIGFSSDRIDEQLALFLTLCLIDKDITPAKVNQLLGAQFQRIGFEFIKECSREELTVEVLNQLNIYLNSSSANCSESPCLAGLKRFLVQNWLLATSKDERTAREIFSTLQQKAISLKSSRIDFFATQIEDRGEEELFSKLRAGDSEGLLVYLTANSPNLSP